MMVKCSCISNIGVIINNKVEDYNLKILIRRVTWYMKKALFKNMSYRIYNIILNPEFIIYCITKSYATF